eukprot:m.194853 g.194853  ORF g.194853 m.194853 type:complete len:1312 (+) comp13662_c0_seq8:158-4093(+)
MMNGLIKERSLALNKTRMKEEHSPSKLFGAHQISDPELMDKIMKKHDTFTSNGNHQLHLKHTNGHKQNNTQRRESSSNVRNILKDLESKADQLPYGQEVIVPSFGKRKEKRQSPPVPKKRTPPTPKKRSSTVSEVPGSSSTNKPPSNQHKHTLSTIPRGDSQTDMEEKPRANTISFAFDHIDTSTYVPTLVRDADKHRIAVMQKARTMRSLPRRPRYRSSKAASEEVKKAREATLASLSSPNLRQQAPASAKTTTSSSNSSLAKARNRILSECSSLEPISETKTVTSPQSDGNNHKDDDDEDEDDDRDNCDGEAYMKIMPQTTRTMKASQKEQLQLLVDTNVSFNSNDFVNRKQSHESVSSNSGSATKFRYLPHGRSSEAMVALHSVLMGRSDDATNGEGDNSQRNSSSVDDGNEEYIVVGSDVSSRSPKKEKIPPPVKPRSRKASRENIITETNHPKPRPSGTHSSKDSTTKTIAAAAKTTKQTKSKQRQEVQSKYVSKAAMLKERKLAKRSSEEMLRSKSVEALNINQAKEQEQSRVKKQTTTRHHSSDDVLLASRQTKKGRSNDINTKPPQPPSKQRKQPIQTTTAKASSSKAPEIRKEIRGSKSSSEIGKRLQSAIEAGESNNRRGSDDKAVYNADEEKQIQERRPPRHRDVKVDDGSSGRKTSKKPPKKKEKRKQAKEEEKKEKMERKERKEREKRELKEKKEREKEEEKLLKEKMKRKKKQKDAKGQLKLKEKEKEKEKGREGRKQKEKKKGKGNERETKATTTTTKNVRKSGKKDEKKTSQLQPSKQKERRKKSSQDVHQKLLGENDPLSISNTATRLRKKSASSTAILNTINKSNNNKDKTNSAKPPSELQKRHSADFLLRKRNNHQGAWGSGRSFGTKSNSILKMTKTSMEHLSRERKTAKTLKKKNLKTVPSTRPTITSPHLLSGPASLASVTLSSLSDTTKSSQGVNEETRKKKDEQTTSQAVKSNSCGNTFQSPNRSDETKPILDTSKISPLVRQETLTKGLAASVGKKKVKLLKKRLISTRRRVRTTTLSDEVTTTTTTSVTTAIVDGNGCRVRARPSAPVILSSKAHQQDPQQQQHQKRHRYTQGSIRKPPPTYPFGKGSHQHVISHNVQHSKTAFAPPPRTNLGVTAAHTENSTFKDSPARRNARTLADANAASLANNGVVSIMNPPSYTLTVEDDDNDDGEQQHRRDSEAQFIKKYSIRQKKKSLRLSKKMKLLNQTKKRSNKYGSANQLLLEEDEGEEESCNESVVSSSRPSITMLAMLGKKVTVDELQDMPPWQREFFLKKQCGPNKTTATAL